MPAIKILNVKQKIVKRNVDDAVRDCKDVKDVKDVLLAQRQKIANK